MTICPLTFTSQPQTDFRPQGHAKSLTLRPPFSGLRCLVCSERLCGIKVKATTMQFISVLSVALCFCTQGFYLP